jgi:hypothetical protein
MSMAQKPEGAWRIVQHLDEKREPFRLAPYQRRVSGADAQTLNDLASRVRETHERQYGAYNSMQRVWRGKMRQSAVSESVSAQEKVRAD